MLLVHTCSFDSFSIVISFCQQLICQQPWQCSRYLVGPNLLDLRVQFPLPPKKKSKCENQFPDGNWWPAGVFALLFSHFLPLIPSSPQPFLSRSFILQSFLQSVVLSLSANTKKKKKKVFLTLMKNIMKSRKNVKENYLPAVKLKY